MRNKKEMDLVFELDVEAEQVREKAVQRAREQVALLANDIRVLTSQLNEAIKRAAEARLRVEVSTSVVDINGPAPIRQKLAVRIWSEVQ